MNKFYSKYKRNLFIHSKVLSDNSAIVIFQFVNCSSKKCELNVIFSLLQKTQCRGCDSHHESLSYFLIDNQVVGNRTARSPRTLEKMQNKKKPDIN